jgi:RNA polymerase-binding protein DksA
MATKRKPGAVRTKASKPHKKSPARPKATAAKSARAAKPKAHAKAPAPKPAKAPKAAGSVKAGKVAAAPTAKGGSPSAKAVPAGKAHASKAAATKAAATNLTKPKLVSKPPPVVRPIGALPPEAVARAVQKARPPVARVGVPVARPVRDTSEGGAPGVTEKDFKEFEQRLLAERAKILKEMGHLENTVLKVNQRDSAGDLSGYSYHMADVGTDAMEREKAFLFASNEGALLKEINEALRRVYSGDYGVCENCGKPIARPRLEAMPYARLCLSCKELEERAGRGAS